MRVLPSVLGVIGGIVVLTVLSFAIEWAVDPILLHLFPRALPDQSALNTELYASLLMYSYTFLCVVAGGYATAWIAGRAPVLHAVTMGVVQLALTIYAMKAVVVHAPERNWIIGTITVVPAAWIGGLLRARQTRRPAAIHEMPGRAVA